MSKLRSLSTAFWSDPFVEDLSPSEKLLFIYLITNEKTNMLGIYESSIRKMSFETGISKVEIENALKGFERLKKVKYINNYVILVNYMKHQHFNTNMKKSAIDVYNSLPTGLKDSNLDINKKNPLEGFERLLNHYGMVSKVEVEVEHEEEDEAKVEDEASIGEPKPPTPTLEDRKLKFKADLIKAVTKSKKERDKDELNKFYNYWTEHGENDRKMRFEKETSFGFGRRLGTWFKSDNNSFAPKVKEKIEVIPKGDDYYTKGAKTFD